MLQTYEKNNTKQTFELCICEGESHNIFSKNYKTVKNSCMRPSRVFKLKPQDSRIL